MCSRIFLKNVKHHIVIFDNGMLKIKVPFYSYFKNQVYYFIL